MKFLYLFFFGILLSFTPAVAQSDINQMDEQGKRHGVWKKMYSKTQQLRYEGTFEHGKEVGIFKFYCEDCKDQPTAVKEFNSKDGTSVVKYYTVKGKLVSEGKMDGKKRIGEWVYFQKKSNEVMTKENYLNGLLDGVKVTYYPGGTIAEEVTYKNGVIEGESKYYSPKGVLLRKLTYRNDLLQGLATYYDGYGNVSIEGQYKDDKKDGLWKYYKDGKVKLEEVYPKPLEKVNN